MVKLIKDRTFLSGVISIIIISMGIFYFIPKITEKNTIDTITKNSINSVEQMKLMRAYYVDNVTKDIKEYAPNISFNHTHEGADSKIPYPTTTIHDLSKLFSDNTGIKFRLYSDFPFKNRENRKLDEKEQEAIAFTKKNPEGIYVRRDLLNEKEVLRVAVTDYMTSQSCVDCHNSHPEKTWKEGKWKLGDKRGVIEVITPIEDELNGHKKLLNTILIIICLTLSIVVLINFFLRKHEEG
ncbi:MAG: DUF3365 domain-containing protein [Campylobacterales bacterium]|nr:DUF3365 domain-containing protein [Campylobacterales bacterium]